jgi:threonine synthase
VSYVVSLRCVLCGRTHSTKVPYTCPECGEDGILDVQYEYSIVREKLSRKVLVGRSEFSQWRYHELLPVDDDAVLPRLQVGWTPICQSDALARHIGIRTLRIKDESRNPTGSLKDRASAVGAARALSEGNRVVCCASTGNAASSLAGMAASMGLRSVIFVPQRVPEPKLAQLLIFGATVFRTQGGYENAFWVSQQACKRWGWYNRNCAINPYLVEGKKTVGFEIAEQLGWALPEWVAVSVGDGCTIAGAWKAFREFRELGLINQTPRMLGVQATGAAPISNAFQSGKSLYPVTPDTIADSIAVGAPRNWRKAVLAARESGGAMITVTDDEIWDAMRYTSRLAGIFPEPAAAASVAGLKRAIAEGIVSERSSALAVVTGSGLKDIRAVQQAVSAPFDLAADGHGLEETLQRQAWFQPSNRDMRF